MYRYEYSVLNDGSLGMGVAVELFDIFFDPSLYEELSLSIVTPDPPAGNWSETILFSVPGLPAAYEALALASGIPDGADVAGFAVAFRWLGSGSRPGAQPFEIVDQGTFDVLESGRTVPAATPIPEPGTLLLFSTSLVGLVWWRRRIRRTGT